MRIHSANLLPLVLLTLLAALTFWLERSTQGDNASRNGKGRHDPDFVVSDFNMRQFNVDGSLKHALAARKMLHYPDDDSTLVREPTISFHARSTPVRLSAREAKINQDGKEVLLTGEVQMLRDGVDDSSPLLVTTEELLVYPDDEIARSARPVTITQGPSVMSGSGIEVDNRQQILKLLGRVHGSLYRATPNSP